MTILCMVYLSAAHKNVADINDFGSTSFPFQKDIKAVRRSGRARSLNICEKVQLLVIYALNKMVYYVLTKTLVVQFSTHILNALTCV